MTGEAVALTNLGLVYLRQARYQRAVNQLKQALTGYRQLGHRIGEAVDALPCEVNRPVSADRCATPSDANWAGSNLWSQNPWEIFLQGGALNGTLGDPAQVDNLYQMGFSRLNGSVPYPSFGAYSGYSVALNPRVRRSRPVRQRVPGPR